ncbi:MAG: hypothetical protein VYE40_03380 [Myxococcota bacterium]|jgi:hypothetical protein|nr:hypothetical protein [Myxococcota bacterium]
MIRGFDTKKVLALALCLTLTACGRGDREEDRNEGDDCLSNREYFSKQVWKPVLEQRCFSCHNSSGQAKYTNLVFQPSSQTGHIDANLEAFAKTARYEADGKSILLQKPLGGLDHKGGPVLEEGSKEFEALSRMLERLDNPVECEDTESVETHFAKVELLDPGQTLRKTTLNLGGRLPTPEEEALVEEQGIDGLDQVIENLAQEEAFYQRVEEMFNDMFLTDRYLGGSDAVGLLDRDIFPEARWYENGDDKDFSGEDPAEVEGARQYANNSVARAPLKLISHVIRNDKPFTEILTADYMVANGYVARIYGADSSGFSDKLDPNEWREVKIPGMPHAGVLSSPMFLNRFPTTATNRNRHRSRMVYKFFLATDVMALAERPVDPTSIEDFNPTLYNPQCTSCHGVIDPVAGAFQNWNDRGMYAPPEDGWYEEMLPPGFGQGSIPFSDRSTSLPWLAEKFTADQRFATATIHNFYRGITGHELVTPLGEDQEIYDNQLVAQEFQQEFFDGVAAKFAEGNFNAKIVIAEIVKSPYFRTINIPEYEGEKEQQYVDQGLGRLLTPEMLHRKIIAVTGEPWTHFYNKDNNFLLRTNDYRILYGGIDSDGVTQRITAPNGIMANVQWRMANEMACRTTAKDFLRGKEDRFYFRFVETNFVPEDANGFLIQEAETAIKQNIQYLHWHMLGERVTLDDAELERTYNLWYDTWKEGQQLLAEEEISRDLMGRCRADRDPETGEDLPDNERIRRDDLYTIRAWQAVITYMLADYHFLYE